jgi:hypothetical protein
MGHIRVLNDVDSGIQHERLSANIERGCIEEVRGFGFEQILQQVDLACLHGLSFLGQRREQSGTVNPAADQSLLPADKARAHQKPHQITRTDFPPGWLQSFLRDAGTLPLIHYAVAPGNRHIGGPS